MSTTFAIKIAAMLLFLCGCSQEGYDLQLKADSFPNRVDIVIDYKNGQTPLAVEGVQGHDTYEIEVDPNGRAAINCTWPISRGHRTFVVLPDKTIRDTLTFSMKLGGVIMAKSNGKSSSGSDDGTVYWYELSRPSDTKQNDNGNRE